MSTVQGKNHRQTLAAALQTYYIMTRDCINDYAGHIGHIEEVNQMNRELCQLVDLMNLYNIPVPKN